MYPVGLLILENLHFDTNFIMLCGIEQKLWPFIGFGGHLGGHLEITHSDLSGFVLVFLIGLLILENLYFDTNFIKLYGLEQKLWVFIGFGGHIGGHLGFATKCRGGALLPKFF